MPEKSFGGKRRSAEAFANRLRAKGIDATVFHEMKRPYGSASFKLRDYYRVQWRTPRYAPNPKKTRTKRNCRNPKQLLFKSKAAAVAYARAHGAKKFSVKKLKRGRA